MPGDQLFSKAEIVLKAGIGCLQYREKNAAPDQKKQRAQQLLTLCRQYNTPLIINDDLELALEIDADGVHLGQSDGSLTDARHKLGEDKILGATCHASLDLAEQAQRAGADYLAFGRFFPSTTKPNAPAAPLELIAQAKARFQRPIVVIGGIDSDNSGQVFDQGADMIAVVNSLFGTHDPSEALNRFCLPRAPLQINV
ncbi:thiamine-phosphate diphosphorylase [Oceanospirillum linum]|uniref:Thiamine-phosphate synthase n=2 Tax=Oceanospirillum linum TaxID=966 RepID=A0A1T1H8U3_OCELI|nr:thiamine-phosphate diphosphorylase [Oceanospirillum linum]